METENNQNVFSVFITQKSENWVIETELFISQMDFSLWVPPFLSFELWKQIIKLWKQIIQTASKIL